MCVQDTYPFLQADVSEIMALFLVLSPFSVFCGLLGTYFYNPMFFTHLHGVICMLASALILASSHESSAKGAGLLG